MFTKVATYVRGATWNRQGHDRLSCKRGDKNKSCAVHLVGIKINELPIKGLYILVHNNIRLYSIKRDLNIAFIGP